MTPDVRKPKSQLAKFKASIAKAIPGGLPKSVAAFYAKSDGLTTKVNDDEEVTLVGLKEMFANVFSRPKVLTSKDDVYEALSEGTFVEELYSSDIEISTTPADLARANLLLRLKLLVRIPGESVAFAIDFYSGGKEPVIYEMDLYDQALPLLGLGFEDFVTIFERLGARRWHFAFLGKKAERIKNIDLAAEFDASLSNLDDSLVAALRGQFKRGADPNAWKSALATSAKTTKKTTAKTKADQKGDPHGLSRWCVTPPAIDLGKGKANAWRDSNAYLDHAATLVSKGRAIELLAQGVRKELRAKNATMSWAIVAAAASAFTDNETFALISLGMPIDALVAFAKHRDWRTAQLGSLANRAQFVWGKDPAVPTAFTKASSKLAAELKKAK